MSYKYKDPISEGFAKVKFTTKQHNALFKNTQKKWFTSYEYYIREDKFVMHRFESVSAKILNWVTMPIMILFHGFANWKEVVKDSCSTKKSEKKNGSFVSDTVWAKSDLYKQIVEVLK